MIDQSRVKLLELREPGPLEVVLDVGSGVLLTGKDRGMLQILILEVDSKQTASRVKLPQTDSEVMVQTLIR